MFSGVVYILLNKSIEEEFILEPADKDLTTDNYYWFLEFVAEVPQIVI